MPLPIAKSRLDGDAAAYIARSGAQDRAAINAFVRGVKALGLWESMVCWPLRSSQNAGTGTTAYSLGGLGTYNGTLVNGPTWGSSGVAFVSGSSQTITISSISPIGPDLMLATAQAATSGNLRVLDFGYSGIAVGHWAGFSGQYYWDVRATNGTINRQSGGSVSTAMQFNLGVASPTGSSFSVNGSQILSNAISSELSGSSMSSFKINYNGGNGTIAFVLLSTSVSNYGSIYGLYKQTLGAGLGLP